jgi:hypothetical protein
VERVATKSSCVAFGSTLAGTSLAASEDFTGVRIVRPPLKG